jgi:3-mercaptopyruvate sulfurtransferase SseA
LPKKRPDNSRGSILLMLTGAALILGALGWYVLVIAGQPGGNAPPAAQSAAGVEDHFPQIERITAEEAKTAYDQGEALFLDVRNVEEFTQGRILGAVNIPLLDLTSRIGELDPNDWIITY